MGLFNKGMKIGEGQKYDTTKVASEGLTPEEIAQMDKKARKLIDIYNTDGKAGLSQIELARAMDDFYWADVKDSKGNYDDKLSNKELDEMAKKLNAEKGLSGDAAITRGDLKSFLKAVTKSSKGKETVSRVDTLNNARLADWTENNGYTAVEGQEHVYQKDGKTYKLFDNDDRYNMSRVKQDGDKYVLMTDEELEAEAAQERQAKIDKKAEEIGVKLWDKENGVYSEVTPGGSRLDYIYDDKENKFVRSVYVDDEKGNTIPRAMTQEEIDAENAAIYERVKQRRTQKALATPTDYTVQNGESLTSILKRSLEAQGIEVTKESLAEAKAEFVKNNPKALHGPKGREYLYAGDVVKVAGGLEDKANADSVKAKYRAFETAKAEAEAKAKAEAEAKAKAEAEAKAKAEAEAKAKKAEQDRYMAQRMWESTIRAH